MDKLDMSLWKILRVSQLSWTNRSRSDLSGRKILSSLQVQLLNSKRTAAGSFCHLHIAHCTECATDNVLSRTHPVCVIWLPGIIIRVRSSWISRGYWKLLHTHYSHMTRILCQKNGSKKVKLGTHLDRCVYKVSAYFFEHFRFKYLNMTHQLHTKGRQCFLTDVKWADLKIF